MESPSLVILKILSDDEEKLLAMMKVLQEMKKSFYYCPREGGLRILMRSRHVLGSLTAEAKALGLTVKRFYR